MKLVLFEFTKNCEEFNILVKATSEDASRRDLKQGQLLFESICQNIILIETQLYKIESAITSKNIKIIGESEEVKMFNQEAVLVEYSPEFERMIESWHYLHRHDNDNYVRHIFPSIRKILRFLSSDFDYEKHKLSALDWKKKNKEYMNKVNMDKKFNSESILYINSFENILEYRTPINESIEVVLKYYSEQSFKLKEYIDLFLILR